MSKLDAFIKMVKETVTPDDIIVAVLANIKGNDIKKDPEFFHTAIYELKQEQQFARILEDFDFDVSGLSPFSELLDRVLFRLETASILRTMNPSYEHYHIPQDKKDSLLDRSREKFNGEKSEVILQLSRKFETFLN